MDIPRKISKAKRWLGRGLYAGAGVGALVLISLGVSRLKPAEPGVDRSAVVIDTVKRGSMVREVRGFGKLTPEDIHWIPATTDGRVEKIIVRPGATVKADTVILELSNPELEHEVVDAEMAVKAAEADYTSLRVKLDQAVLDQKANLATVQADYNQAALEAQMNEALAKNGLIAKAAAAGVGGKGAGAHHAARTRKQAAGDRCGIRHRPACRASRASRPVAGHRQTERDAARPPPCASGNQRRAGAAAGGRRPGGRLPGNQPARVANPEHLKAEIQIPETQAKDIQIGQSATVDTHNGIMTGRVSRIDAAVQSGTVTVDVSFEGEIPKGARPDLSVDGTVELERLQDVLYVGRPAFGDEKSVVGIFRLDGDGVRASRVQVKLGRSSVTSVEILGGLKDGDQVIVSDMSAWDNVERVRLNGSGM